MSVRRTSVVAFSVLAMAGAVAIAAPAFFSMPRVALAQNAPNGDREGKETRWLQDLGLSPDQLQQLQSIRGQYREPLQAKRTALRQAQDELRTRMTGDASDDEIRRQFQEVQRLRQEMAELRFESMLAARKIMTDEQRDRFAAKMQEHSRNKKGPRQGQQGMGRGRGRGMGNPGNTP
ncbi:Spy/CpxP family protein refolding chaperone [Geitlerinema sp. PCC 7407]|uniref:Spy/CpxP family protein refolding chaperone n=1 Tax=Geitlerinema sp. PCC 7407 TaxID=1173025 RepID=UPI00029F8C55|nr:Spy/CpxP family protein refolding chaperone [Geitlerinema sp. PCC 7407]AFY64927.1 hypothetical protein GEI7407_0426 [Geitlerinema sp. PCC 7407]